MIATPKDGQQGYIQCTCTFLSFKRNIPTNFLSPTLSQGRCDVNIRNNRNQTPLQLAVMQGHGDLVQLLVVEGADVNVEDEDGDTAMHVALSRPQLANATLTPATTSTTTTTQERGEGGPGSSSSSLYCQVGL